MKKNNDLALLITMLMTLVASPAYADWGSEEVTMQVGETKTLYLPSSVTTKRLKSVNFYSASWNNVQVVSYTNYSVKVKALKAYSSPVIVRCDYYYYVNSGSYTYQGSGAYDFKITVAGETKVKPTKITVPSVVAVEVGESKDIEATVTPANAEYTLSWSINDKSIATVSQSGRITGKSEGYADLKVQADNGVYAMCRISVHQSKPTSVSMRSSLSMTVGDTYRLDPDVYPSNAKTSYSWSSNDSWVASVSSSGLVTAKNAGTATITVRTDNGKTATCKVTVAEKEVVASSVSIESSLSLTEGETYTLTPTVSPSNAKASYSWSSSDSWVASVSSSGLVTAKNAGTATITVKTDNGKTASCKVTVSAKTVTVSSVSIESSLSLAEGETYTLTPTVTPSDAMTSFTWSTSNTCVATVSGSGVITAKAAGTATITVKTNNGKTASCKVTVSAKTAKEYEITFSIYGYENGKVLYEGKPLVGDLLEDYGSFKVAEGKDVELTILPSKGYKIDWLWVDYEDMNDLLVDDVLTISNVKKDLHLVVSFEPDESILSTITSTSDSENKPVVIYDLSGRRVDASEAKGGIFIVNGKKVYLR